ncbi:MAG: metallophosphatase family protein [Chitinispirillaceae bacterium]|nr:metallophosphatase family protein [Chitinispirillaceae bacterium]
MENPSLCIEIDKPIIKIGIISDTHNLLRKEISSVFENVDYIIHAGDIGKPTVLQSLQKIAPTVAVIGNTDVSSWFPELHNYLIIELKGKKIFLIHNLMEVNKEVIIRENINIVIFGHTHKPTYYEKEGILYINPGSAGPERFLLPVSVAELKIGDRVEVSHTIIQNCIGIKNKKLK